MEPEPESEVAEEPEETLTIKKVSALFERLSVKEISYTRTLESEVAEEPEQTLTIKKVSALFERLSANEISYTRT